MTKRLQVLLPDDEMAEIQAEARERNVTVADFVRRAIRAARQDPSRSAEQKLATLRRATRNEFPTGDIDAMLLEIEAGYTSKAAPGRSQRRGNTASR